MYYVKELTLGVVRTTSTYIPDPPDAARVWLRSTYSVHTCMSNVIHVLPTVETAVSDSEAEIYIQSPPIVSGQVSGYVARILYLLRMR